MRRIGLIEKSSQATRFCDYLITLGIHATIEPAGDPGDSPESERQAIWVKDERKVEDAKIALTAFLTDPGDSRFSASAEAAKYRAEEELANKRRLKNIQPVRHRSLPGLGAANSQRPTIVLSMVIICVIAGLVTNFGHPQDRVSKSGRRTESTASKVYTTMSFISPNDTKKSANPFSSILRGEFWRLVTPALLHGSTLHLAMTMMGLFALGGAIERLQGRLVIAVLLLVTAVAGTVVQALWPAWNGGGPNAIGASGAVYGLLGYIWVRPYYDPDFAILIPPSALVLAMLFLLLGVASVISGIANGAHVGGLAAGMVMASLLRPDNQSRSQR